MDLAGKIKQYYFDNFEELPPRKRFHFASRLAAWDNDPQARVQLDDLSAYMLPRAGGTAHDLLARQLNKPLLSAFAYDLRKPFFEKYPRLFGIHEAIFRVRHLMEFYGIDLRSNLLELVGKTQMEALYKQLSEDEAAIRILSRFAISYIFLYEILFSRRREFDPNRLAAIIKGYKSGGVAETHLHFYLVTHAIIADANFYARAIPKERVKLYQQLLSSIEHSVNSPLIKLDNQFEFLVANRIVGASPLVEGHIVNRAENSLDDGGHYIVDGLNKDSASALNALAGSEHRNVLFIMSRSPYPHPS